MVVRSSTAALVSVSDVSESRVTVVVIALPVVLPIISPNTIVVVDEGTVYTVANVVTAAFVFNLNVLAMFPYPKAIARAVTSSTLANPSAVATKVFICDALIYLVVPLSSTKNLSVAARVTEVPSVAPST